MIKVLIHQKDPKIINIYSANEGVPKFINQFLAALKAELGGNIYVLGDLNTLLSPKDTSTIQKLLKDINLEL